mgnify:CR=1 FL=1
MKQKTKGYIVAVISILFSAFLIVLALALSNLAKGDIRERSQDVEDYRKWSVQEKYTQFLIFRRKFRQKQRKWSITISMKADGADL